MHVRKAILEDAEAIAQLHHELGVYHEPYHPIYSLNENPPQSAIALWKDKIKNSTSGDGLVLVAEDKDVVGFLNCIINDRNNPNWKIRKTGHIGAVYVSPAYRRRGVAKALIEEALKWLKEQKIEYVDLNVSVQNPAATAAWTALGFKPHQQVLIQKI